MAKRGDYLKNASAAERERIASMGGDARREKLGKRRTKAIALRAAAVWSAQQKAKKQALSKP